MPTNAIITTNSQEEQNAREYILSAIKDDSELSENSKAQYERAISKYLEGKNEILNAMHLKKYAAGVGMSERKFLSASVGKFAEYAKMSAGNAAQANMSAGDFQNLQALQMKAEALKGAIKTKQSKGSKTHTWLSQKEIFQLLKACETRKSGNRENELVTQRDKLVLSLTLGAGLRRAEVVGLKFKDIRLQPIKGKMRTSLHIIGKGAKERTVPINAKLANMLDSWRGVLGAKENEFIIRSLGRNNTPKETITTTALYQMIQKRGAMIGKPKLQPHDLRRTFAQLGYEAGVPITQVSRLLGHESVATTQKYLNTELDLETTISDFIILE
jgi:integrase